MGRGVVRASTPASPSTAVPDSTMAHWPYRQFIQVVLRSAGA
jgi:hypothetical protein